ncbi:hypothetical protein N7493_000984 [Penicillium malachiteum]|uniref:protein S-acyltransferase n=1 Tax=Penicillium malachiteum TaxID=1324776 RepID=A0AAD6HXP6_9EURO|nr:hypothetical protein N7493_000984 [Penicillium malachiteum]
MAEEMTPQGNFSKDEDLLSGPDNEADSHDLRLLRASKNGWDDLVKTLLEQLDDLECGEYEENGHTPLTFAASNGHERVVRILLEHGADIERRNHSSSSQFRYFSKLPDQTPLAWAAGNGHATVVRILLEARANVNGKGSEGSMTPLATAAVRGYDDTVWALLEQDDIELERRYLEPEHLSDGRTVLSHCAEDGQANIIARLISKGANPNSQDPLGRSPLFWAAESGRTAVVRILLAHGADINQMDQKHSLRHYSAGGQTALFYAASWGHAYIAQLLIEKGADPNHLDNGRWTSLGYAVSRGHVSVVRVLLEHKADPDKGKIHATALREYVRLNLASRNEPARPGFEEIHQLLQEFCPESRTTTSWLEGFFSMWE